MGYVALLCFWVACLGICILVLAILAVSPTLVRVGSNMLIPAVAVIILLAVEQVFLDITGQNKDSTDRKRCL